MWLQKGPNIRFMSFGLQQNKRRKIIITVKNISPFLVNVLKQTFSPIK